MKSSFRQRRGVLLDSTLETGSAPSSVRQEPMRSDRTARARRLLQAEVSFIHSADFEREDAEDQLMSSGEVDFAKRSGRQRPPSGVPSHLVHLWEVGLLKPQQELQLFRRMNFLKYRANAQRSRLNPERPKVELLNQIEQDLTDADSTRNYLVRANLRLVVSIARKFVAETNTLDELISDGNLILMKAVDRFDYGRGFRFSTYATHAVQREFFQRYKTVQRRRVTEVATDPEILLQSVACPEDFRERIVQERQLTYLKEIMSTCLEPRESEIVDLRFGLNSDDGGQTLREVGEKLNISKERVRQLQTRAIEKIQELARCNIGTTEL